MTTDSPQPGSWTSRVTPADVRYKQFNTTRLRPGYDEEEVDAFLDEVEAELFGLTAENEELRAKLAAVRRSDIVRSWDRVHRCLTQSLTR